MDEKDAWIHEWKESSQVRFDWGGQMSACMDWWRRETEWEADGNHKNAPERYRDKVPVADLGLCLPLGRRWELPILFFLSQNITASCHRHTHTHTLTDWQRERERESDGRGVSSSPGLKHVQDEWQSISVWVRGRTERHSITEAACVPKCVTACLWCVRGARRVIADECVCPTLRIYVWVWERAWVSAQRYVSWWQSSLGTGVFVCERNKVCVSSCAYFSVRFQCSQWACALRMCVFVCLERERETERASIALISSQPVESSRCCSIQKECRQSQTRDRGRGTQVRERGEGVKEAEREIREKRKEKREEGSVQRRRKW